MIDLNVFHCSMVFHWGAGRTGRDGIRITSWLNERQSSRTWLSVSWYSTVFSWHSGHSPQQHLFFGPHICRDKCSRGLHSHPSFPSMCWISIAADTLLCLPDLQYTTRHSGDPSTTRFLLAFSNSFFIRCSHDLKCACMQNLLMLLGCAPMCQRDIASSGSLTQRQSATTSACTSLCWRNKVCNHLGWI